jgi:hypothetical protein
MADLRTLTLGLLVKDDQFRKSLKDSQKATSTFSNKVGKALKIGAAAFAALGVAAGAAAIKIGKDAVEGAAADQKAQDLLAKSLKNVTKATDIQIKSVEDYIAKTERSSAVNADLLRPSLDRLVRSTKDVTEAQKLQKLALDISAGTGKDLATVTEALGKAYDGNLGALKRIGVPLDENIVKSKDFDAAVKVLSETFEGQAEVAANTFAGRLEKIKLRIDEAKDEIGFALLPVLERLSIFITENILPAFAGLARGLTGGSKSVKGATKETQSAFAELGIVFNDNDIAAFDLGVALKELSGTLSELFANVDTGSAEDSGLVKFIKLIERIVTAIDSAIEKVRTLNRVLTLDNPFSQLGLRIGESISGDFTGSRAESQARLESIAGSQRRPNTQPITVNVRGAIDPQGTARTVTRVLTQQRAISGVRVTAPSGFF